MPEQRVVVVGAGLAGLRSAESLRANGFTGSITVVGAEPWPPYNRPPVSKSALTAPVGIDDLRYRVRASAADVDWRLGAIVACADVDSAQVVLTGGEALAYDGLVVASGVRSRRIDVPGPVEGRHVLRTLDDAAAVRPALVPGARVVVVGAGFIGCELAATARGLGCRVTVVAADPLPMIRPLGPLLAAELRRRHEDRGVEFRLGTEVLELLGAGAGVTGLRLADGTEVDADVVVEAVGSDPSVAWLHGRGLDTADGVRVDNGLRVLRDDGGTVPGVVAAGDVARYPNPRFDDVPRRVEHWDNATATGRRAGAVLAAHLAAHLAGARAGNSAPEPEPWSTLPSFWSDQYDISLQAFGLPALADPDGAAVLHGDLHGEVVVGYRRGDDLVAVVGLGALAQVLELRDSVGRSRP